MSTTPDNSTIIRLGNGSTDLVVDVSTGVPTVLHWGRPLGSDAAVEEMQRGMELPVVAGSADVVAPITLVPEHGSGFTGRPGLAGRRGGGRDWAPRFAYVRHAIGADGQSLSVVAEDPIAGLRLESDLALDHVVCVAITITNMSPRRYSLDGLTITLPLPDHADELMTFSGRWAHEFGVSRRQWPSGGDLRENRSGRTSHETPPLVVVGSSGFGEWHGEVWAIHLAWSGNHTRLLDRLGDGRRFVQVGELLHPGEIVLEHGESYTTPVLLAAHSGEGLTDATQQFHRSLRGSPAHPTTPRPVTLNTWEAVYFDQRRERLVDLAVAASDLGIERFVLDDGWFGDRRDDTRGLGDWEVSADVHPDGLVPLIDRVVGLGMQFGIWVEPEMVNPDSNLYRTHPDWALTTEGYEPVLARNQLVLDLSNPEAFDHILRRLDELLTDHAISYVKWDMNRDHIQGSDNSGAPGTHRQTIALYALIDELRRRHPNVEFESCASGGGRIDHAILQRAERVWTSDCNDPLDRQSIQRGVSMLIPPEVMGAHIGPPRSHTTGRTSTLAFRGATALFGHLGVEWDVTAISDRDRDRLRSIIALHKKHRMLLHNGDTVRFDTAPGVIAHGVYALDRSEAIVSFAQMTTAPSLTPEMLRLPGLDHDRLYRVEHLRVPGEYFGPARSQPTWLVDGLSLTGRQLDVHGFRPPTLNAESAVLFHLTSQT